MRNCQMLSGYAFIKLVYVRLRKSRADEIRIGKMLRGLLSLKMADLCGLYVPYNDALA